MSPGFGNFVVEGLVVVTFVAGLLWPPRRPH